MLGPNNVAVADEGPVKMPVKASKEQPLYDWTGPYVGFHFGYGGGSFGPGTNPLASHGVVFPSSITGLIGGYQAGYNVRLDNRFVLGLEGDVTFISPPVRSEPATAAFNTTFDYFATVRARIGHAFGDILPYVTGGLAWGQTKVDINENGHTVSSKSATHVGWTAGIGVEAVLTGNWTGKLEYNYIDLASRTYELDIAAQPTLPVDPKVHVAKLGLNYRLWDTTPASDSRITKAAKKSETKSETTESSDWNIHGQTTFLPQGYPRFRSPYQGANSLPGGGQVRETWTTTAFIGWRIWEGGEFYFNPELDQGFGVGDTMGLAGFPNGEAQKAGGTFPKFRAQRYFLRQTFGFGGEQETVEDRQNQLPGKRDIDRITLTVGRFAVGDFFDMNAYAHDPRADFMNWAIWESAAYDFPADMPGYTRGVVVDLNRKHWALRAGLFQVPEQPNSDNLVFKTGGAVAEWEGRYQFDDQPGKLRLGVFANRGRTGNYNEALAIAAANPTININDIMMNIRRQRPKYGFYANVEQAVSKDVGVFARASWNDGSNEILSFTDIDRSVSGGVSIKGSSWDRPDDKVGIAVAVNGLSGPHRDFLAAGGLGLLIGDGKLNYREEAILETYYAWHINKWATATADYQFIMNPAYNADRGPVSLFAARLHGEF
jgi:high affinity Mn2+ porin